MIQRQLKLAPTKAQERELERWLFHLTAVWNWAIRKIELDAKDGIYYSEMSMYGMLKGHSAKLGIPAHVLNGTVSTAWRSWRQAFRGVARRPRLKGHRNRLNSILFPDPLRRPSGNRVTLLGIRAVRFHKQELPEGRIKNARVVRRASGWYLCLFIDAAPRAVPAISDSHVGIDPGFSSLLTLSDGQKIGHPRELEAGARRLAQAQHGGNRELAARLQERITNQRKDRNHKLSRRLVAENQFIAFSKDNHSIIRKRFGKSVASSGHAQLRQMLSYKSKCRTDGLGVYVEVDSRNSTKTCSACGALSGPTGLSGLKVRQWTCAHCGAEHDRDVNAAINTLIAGAGLAHERLARVA